MDIVNCRHCGKETYADILRCPHCGIASPGVSEAAEAEIAEAKATGNYSNLSDAALHKVSNRILITTETMLVNINISRRLGILVSNKFVGEASTRDIQELALVDLKMQALCLGANGVIAVTMDLIPLVSGGDRVGTNLYLSATGTAVYIEDLWVEAEA